MTNKRPTIELLAALTAAKVADAGLADLPLIGNTGGARAGRTAPWAACIWRKDTLLDHKVALKFLRSLRHDEAARQRFFIEARAVPGCHTTTSSGIYRISEVLGQRFWCQFVAGRSLIKLPLPLSCRGGPHAQDWTSHGRSLSGAPAGRFAHDSQTTGTFCSDDGTVEAARLWVKLKLRDGSHASRSSPLLLPTSASRLAATAPQDDFELQQSPLPDRIRFPATPSTRKLTAKHRAQRQIESTTTKQR